MWHMDKNTPDRVNLQKGHGHINNILRFRILLLFALGRTLSTLPFLTCFFDKCLKSFLYGFLFFSIFSSNDFKKSCPLNLYIYKNYIYISPSNLFFLFFAFAWINPYKSPCAGAFLYHEGKKVHLNIIRILPTKTITMQICGGVAVINPH